MLEQIGAMWGQIADKFKDAFVVAFIDGKRVDMSKALEIFRKNQKKK